MDNVNGNSFGSQTLLIFAQMVLLFLHQEKIDYRIILVCSKMSI